MTKQYHFSMSLPFSLLKADNACRWCINRNSYSDVIRSKDGGVIRTDATDYLHSEL